MYLKLCIVHSGKWAFYTHFGDRYHHPEEQDCTQRVKLGFEPRAVWRQIAEGLHCITLQDTCEWPGLSFLYIRKLQGRFKTQRVGEPQRLMKLAWDEAPP